MPREKSASQTHPTTNPEPPPQRSAAPVAHEMTKRIAPKEVIYMIAQDSSEPGENDHPGRIQCTYASIQSSECSKRPPRKQQPEKSGVLRERARKDQDVAICAIPCTHYRDPLLDAAH